MKTLASLCNNVEYINLEDCKKLTDKYVLIAQYVFHVYEEKNKGDGVFVFWSFFKKKKIGTVLISVRVLRGMR